MGLTAAVLLFKFEPGNEKHTRYNTPGYIHMSVQISCSYTVRIYKVLTADVFQFFMKKKKVPRILPPSLRVAESPFQCEMSQSTVYIARVVLTLVTNWGHRHTSVTSFVCI